MSLLLLFPGTPGAPATPPLIPLHPAVEVAFEFAGAGAGWTAVTDVLAAPSIVIAHGIEGSSPVDRVARTPTAQFSLRNDASNSVGLLGYYSLHHANRRTGWALNIGCRIRLQDPADGAWYVRFIGKVDVIDVQPWVKGTRRVAVTAVGWMDEAARWKLTPEVGEQLDKRGDEILTAILAAMPTQPVATDFDLGREAYPYALDQSGNASQTALTELQKLAASEFGYIYERPDGTLRYEGRHARLLMA